MLTKSDLEKLAVLRLEDAVFLQQCSRCSSAYYLAGYSLELAIKACIAKLIQPNTIPDKAFINAIYTHRFEVLLGVAGLKSTFESEIKTNAALAAHWAIANNWTEESRYAFWDPFAAGSLLQSISDPTNGVFQWVKKHW
jgi:hypothetical protein